MAAALPPEPDAPIAAVTRPFSRLRALLTWIAFILIVAGVRLAFVEHFGSAMPLLDQWDDEGARIFEPYLEGRLSLGHVFGPHNEHRPVIARLLALSSLAINGQWDARMQMVLNVGIATLLAAAVAWLGIRIAGDRHRVVVLVAVACWSCLPFAWENTTWAFQSSFYFLLLFSLLAIHGFVRHPAFSRGWFLAVAAALLACLSMGSGFLAAAAVLLVLGLRFVTGRARLHDSLATGAVCVAIVAVALALRVSVPDHDPLRARSAEEFISVFARALAWPLGHHAAMSLIICAPIGLLAIAYVRRKAIPLPSHDTGAETLLAVAGWVALQSAAVAYARGGGIGPHMISSRYMDILALGALVNFIALLGIARSPFGLRRFRQLPALLVGVWAAAVLLGALALSMTAYLAMRGRADQAAQAEHHVRAYLLTGDVAQLSAPVAAIAYPSTERLQNALDAPKIRQILPANIRPPLAIEPEGSSGPFVLQTDASGRRIWSSQADGTDARPGEMRSQVLHPTLAYVSFEVRGRLRERMTVKLQDEPLGRRHGAEFEPTKAEWRTGYAKVDGPFRITAWDEDAKRSIAFTEPREVGRFSYYTERLLGSSVYILGAGILIATSLAMHGHLSRAENAASSS